MNINGLRARIIRVSEIIKNGKNKRIRRVNYDKSR